MHPIAQKGDKKNRVMRYALVVPNCVEVNGITKLAKHIPKNIKEKAKYSFSNFASEYCNNDERMPMEIKN